MGVFSRVDYLSLIWAGKNGDQSKRMVDFLTKYMSRDREKHSLAVKLWRHTLMHTARPRALHDGRTGKALYWLLHWGEHLPKEQHYEFSETSDTRILNLALMYLIEDLQHALTQYLTDLSASTDLQSAAARATQIVDNQSFKVY